MNTSISGRSRGTHINYSSLPCPGQGGGPTEESLEEQGGSSLGLKEALIINRVVNKENGCGLDKSGHVPGEIDDKNPLVRLLVASLPLGLPGSMWGIVEH